MNLLIRQPPDQTDKPRVLALFGLGLIGSAIRTALETASSFERRVLPFSWDDPQSQGAELATIANQINTEIETSTRPGHIAIVYSAGRCGFSAPQDKTARELQSFQSIIEWLNGLAAQHRDMEIFFHLLSSAGGLFEGAVHVNRQSVPDVQRPYGQLKLRQEKLLLAAAPNIAKSNYRISSVYGHIEPGARMGLIPTLIRNGVRKQVTAITGQLTTLRDYVFNNDIADYVARCVLAAEAHAEPKIAILASGKSSCLYEIQRMVERVIGQKIYVTLDPNPSNDRNITFSSDVMPQNWRPTDLATGIRTVYTHWIAHGSERAFYAAAH